MREENFVNGGNASYGNNFDHCDGENSNDTLRLLKEPSAPSSTSKQRAEGDYKVNNEKIKLVEHGKVANYASTSRRVVLESTTDIVEGTQDPNNFDRNKEISNKRKLVLFIASMLSYMMSAGFKFGLPVVYVDVIHDLNVTRTEASLMMSVTNGVIYGTGFLSSWVFNMIGPVKCIAIGGVLFSAGLFVSSLANHIVQVILSLGILTGLGGSLLLMTSLNVVGLSFGRHEALALSFATFGAGIGSFILPYAFEFLIQQYGWRGSFMVYGGVMLSSLIASFVLKLSLPEEVRSARKKAASSFQVGVFKIMAFNMYLISTFTLGIFYLTANMFLVDIVEGYGYTREDGAGLITAMGVSSLVSRIALGSFFGCSRFPTVYAVPLIHILTGVSLVTFGLFEDYWLLFAMSVANGFMYGAYAAVAASVPHEIVGTEYFPTGMGLVSTAVGIGNSISGPIGGAIKDITGSYDMFYYSAGVVLTISSGLLVIVAYQKYRQLNHSYVKLDK